MKRGRVKSTSGLNVREKPNGQQVDVLTHNQEIDITDEVTFYRIRSASGKVGYVHGDYVDIMPPRSLSRSQTGEEEGIETLLQPSEEFNSTIFSGSEFIGDPAKVDKDFVPELNRVNSFAKAKQVKIWVTSSTRNINEQVRGAIVPPATNSCHFVGHAIDMNVMFEQKLYNSKALKKSKLSTLPQPVQDFIKCIQDDPILRWGGDFNTQDPVHIDDNFFLRNKLMYKAKLLSRVSQLNAQ